MLKHSSSQIPICIDFFYITLRVFAENNVDYDRFIEPEKVKPDEVNFPQPINSEIEEMILDTLGW